MLKSILKTVFSGIYTLERQVNSGQWFCEGERVMENISETEILCKESGICKINDRPQRFFQKQFLVIMLDNFYIKKSDHTLLHQFSLNQFDSKNNFPIKFDDTHFCKKDIYRITMILKSFDEFTTLYTVNGPTKKNEIATNYFRIKK